MQCDNTAINALHQMCTKLELALYHHKGYLGILKPHAMDLQR